MGRLDNKVAFLAGERKESVQQMRFFFQWKGLKLWSEISMRMLVWP